MAEKPTYEELVKRVKELENEKLQANEIKSTLIKRDEWLSDKIDLKPSPEITHLEVDLGSIINVKEIQSIMDDFYYLTNMVTALLDLKGNVIEATGWQDICTKFHRMNPQTARNCTESDLFLAKNLKPGEYAGYKCKNGLWDVVTPLYVGTKHLGNVFTGQFFYDDDEIDEDFFIKQAEKYGFDKESYLDALRKIPRYNEKTIDHLMNFLVKFTTYVSKISLSNIRFEKEIRNRKKAEEALNKSETRLRSLINSLPDLVWLKDSDGVYLFCNSQFECFFGAEEKEIVGKTDYDFVDRELADFFYERDRSVIATGKSSLNEEKVFFTEDGCQVLLEIINTPIYDAEGNIVGVLGIGRDITERKKTQEIMIQSEKMLSVGGLAAGMAHEINNPLAGMMQNASVIKSRLQNLEMPANKRTAEEVGISMDDIKMFMAKRDIPRMVNAINESGRRVSEIVNNMLSFARKTDANISFHYPDQLMDQILELAATDYDLKNRYDFKTIKIIKQYDNNQPKLPCEGTNIQQVFLNILRNGAQAMQMANIGSPEFILRIYPEKNSEMICIEIKDNGPGMDKETMSKIFDPFFTTKPVGMGIGLGLSVSYFIITENHKGTLDVVSEPGEGANFIIRLPLKP